MHSYFTEFMMNSNLSALLYGTYSGTTYVQQIICCGSYFDVAYGCACVNPTKIVYYVIIVAGNQ